MLGGNRILLENTSLAITPISRLCLRTRERIRSSRFIVGREITGAPALLPDGFRRVIGKTLRFLEKSYSDLALCVSCAENAHLCYREKMLGV